MRKPLIKPWQRVRLRAEAAARRGAYERSLGSGWTTADGGGDKPPEPTVALVREVNGVLGELLAEAKAIRALLERAEAQGMPVMVTSI